MNDIQKLGYTIPESGMISFPITDPKATSWTKTVNGFSLFLASKPGVPYGKYSRLAMILMCTEALRSKSGVWEIPSIKSTMRDVGMTSMSGKAVDAFHNQLHRLALTTLSFSTDVTLEGGKKIQQTIYNMRIASAAKLDLLKKTASGQMLLEGAYIKFSPEFGQYVHKHPEPVDLGIMLQLDATPQDIIVWASRKASSIKKLVKIPLDNLVQQFYGPVKYASYRYKDMWEAFNTVQKVYPKLKITYEDDGKTLVIHPSAPLVEPSKAKAWLRMNHYWIDEKPDDQHS